MTQVEFGERIFQLRSKMGVTQAEFEDLCELTHGYIAHLELGRRNPSLDIISKIARGTGMTLGQLLDDLPPTPQEKDGYTNKILAYLKRLRDEQKRDVLQIMKLIIRNQ